MNTAAWIALSTLALFALKKWLDLREVLRTIQYHPWSFTVVSSFGLAGALFEKPIRFIARGGARTVTRKYLDFQEAGSDIISAVSLFPKTSATTLIADAATIKDITMHRARFPKPVKQYTALTFFGRNIVASEGDEWKRYRKISAPAFSEPNNRLVWDSTVKIMLDLFDNEWGRRDEIVFDHAVELTLPIALFVIGVAGFGRPIGWSDDLAVPPGHRMSFKESLHQRCALAWMNQSPAQTVIGHPMFTSWTSNRMVIPTVAWSITSQWGWAVVGLAITSLGDSFFPALRLCPRAAPGARDYPTQMHLASEEIKVQK